MKKTFLLLNVFLLISCLPAISQKSYLNGFVLVKGTTFQSGDIVTDSVRREVRISDFEILDHAVTNTEYKQFTDAAGYQVPLHWGAGKYRKGKRTTPSYLSTVSMLRNIYTGYQKLKAGFIVYQPLLNLNMLREED